MGLWQERQKPESGGEENVTSPAMAGQLPMGQTDRLIWHSASGPAHAAGWGGTGMDTKA